MKMEPIVSSETSAIRTQTPGNYPKRNKLHLEHGESLKTRTLSQFCTIVVPDTCIRPIDWPIYNLATSISDIVNRLGVFRITLVPVTMPINNSGESPFSEILYCQITVKMTQCLKQCLCFLSKVKCQLCNSVCANITSPRDIGNLLHTHRTCFFIYQQCNINTLRVICAVPQNTVLYFDYIIEKRISKYEYGITLFF